MPCVSHPSPTPAPVICLFWTKFPDLSLELASSMIGREHPAASCMSTCAARLSRPETRDTSPGQAGQSTFPHPALVSCASIRPPTPSNHRFLPASLQQIFCTIQPLVRRGLDLVPSFRTSGLGARHESTGGLAGTLETTGPQPRVGLRTEGERPCGSLSRRSLRLVAIHQSELVAVATAEANMMLADEMVLRFTDSGFGDRYETHENFSP